MRDWPDRDALLSRLSVADARELLHARRRGHGPQAGGVRPRRRGRACPQAHVIDGRAAAFAAARGVHRRGHRHAASRRTRHDRDHDVRGIPRPLPGSGPRRVRPPGHRPRPRRGCHVWDVDGRRYLDLLGGIAVNALGHGHPALVAAVSKQVADARATSPTSSPRRPRSPSPSGCSTSAGAPAGSRVFFANSGTEAIEAAIKLARRTGRTGIVAAEGAFHGRTTGALALTHKAAYREPFEPLLPGVTHVPYGDAEALRSGGRPPAPRQSSSSRSRARAEWSRRRHGIPAGRPRDHDGGTERLLVIDEIQTGIGRTGQWFAFQDAGIVPDAITVAKGLGGGRADRRARHVGPPRSPRCCSPASTARRSAATRSPRRRPSPCWTPSSEQGLLAHAAATGDAPRRRCRPPLAHPLVSTVSRRAACCGPSSSASRSPRRRSRAWLATPGSSSTPLRREAIRLAPPLIITAEQIDTFVAALPALLDAAHAAYTARTTTETS